jgi:hypothetical protein
MSYILFLLGLLIANLLQGLKNKKHQKLFFVLSLTPAIIVMLITLMNTIKHLDFYLLAY